MDARVSEWRRLLVFLRPYPARMVGNVVFNIVAAALDVFAFTLLIPFLSQIFNQPQVTFAPGFLGELQTKLVGAFVVQGDALGSLKVFIIAIVGLVALKNVCLWVAGNLG